MHAYTRESVVNALKRLNKPSTLEDLQTEWYSKTNLIQISISENATGEKEQLMVFNAAVVELINEDFIYVDKDLLHLNEWRSLTIRSIDDDWIA